LQQGIIRGMQEEKEEKEEEEEEERRGFRAPDE
jgi:hypothetical protein